jgi:hypothetical protein
MATIEITNIDSGNVALGQEEFSDELIAVAATKTLKQGTILARLTANGKLVAFATGGSDGSQIPCAVLTYETGRTGAGDIAARVLIGGKVNRNRLIIDVDGNGNNITSAILDQLRARSIVAVTVQQLARTDNPQS